MNLKKTLTVTLLAAAVFSCAKVEEGPVAVTSVTLDRNELTATVGQTRNLYATVLPENATDKTVSWSTSNADVAQVESDGTVRGISVGTAVITAVSGDCKDECNVTVVRQTILAESAALTPESLSLFANETAVLELEYTPSEITEDYVWSSSDTDVATVDSLGNVLAVSAGVATVSVKFKESGTVASAKVSVSEVMKLRRLDSGEIRTSDYNMIRIKRVDTICVARGEVADFQVNVEAYENLGNLKAELLYFCQDESNPSVELDPRIYWTGKVYCSRYWEEWQGGYPWNELNPIDRLFPDILIPTDRKPFNIRNKDNNSFWFDFEIPRDFKEGLYFGRVKIAAEVGGREACAYQDFQVRVYPVTLPEEQSLMVINWQNDDFTAVNDGTSDPGNEKSFAWNMHGKIVRFMNDYGQNGWATRLRPVTSYAEAYVEGGEIKFDFSDWLDEIKFYDKYCKDLKMVQSFCFAGFSDDNDYWDENVTPDKMFVKNVCYLDENGQLHRDYLPPTDQRTHDHLVNLFSQLSVLLHTYTLSNGRKLIDVVAQSIMDEPYDRHKPGYELIARAIKEGCPDLRIMEPTEAPSIDENLMDWPCPNLDRLTTQYDKYKARGTQEQWLYTCLRPQGNCANRIFGQRVLNSRFIHWCNYRYNAIGFLHWGLDCWGYFKWHDRCFPEDAYVSGLATSPGGDAFIIYPGEMEVYPSIRLCNMRNGVRDYELLKMIEKKDPAAARDFCFRVVYENPISQNPSANGVTARWRYYDENVDHFRVTRREMLEYLSEH